MYVYRIQLEQPRRNGKTFNNPTVQFHAADSHAEAEAFYRATFPTHRLDVRIARLSDLTGSRGIDEDLVLKAEVL